MSVEVLEPKLRFKEFEGESFRVVKLGDVTNYFKGFAFKSSDYITNGSNNSRIVRVSDLAASSIKEGNQSIYLSEELLSSVEKYRIKKSDIIVTTVGSRPDLRDSAVGRGIYVDVDGQGLLNQNLLVLRTKEGSVSRFVASQVNSNRYIEFIKSIQRGNANQANITVVDLLSYRIVTTTEQEQQKIASFLTSVDSKINQLIEKHRLLKEYKKGVMQQIFSQKIRFKDEDGNVFPKWEKYHLKDVLLLQSDSLDMKDYESYELITVKRRFSGIVSRGDYLGKDVLVKNQFTIHENEFVISKRQIVHGACGLVPKELEGAIVSNEYNVFRPVVDKLDIDYFNRFSTTPYMRRAYFINSDGVHIEKLLFKTQSWLKTKVQLPCLEEQQKIAQFLQSIDTKIDAVAQQIEQTKTFKQGLLQQMFV